MCVITRCVIKGLHCNMECGPSDLKSRIKNGQDRIQDFRKGGLICIKVCVCVCVGGGEEFTLLILSHFS